MCIDLCIEDIICNIIVGIATIFGYTPLVGECNTSVYYSTEGNILDLVLILIIIFIRVLLYNRISLVTI